MLDRAIGIAGLALAILSIVGPKMFPDMNKKIAVAGFIRDSFAWGRWVNALPPQRRGPIKSKNSI